VGGAQGAIPPALAEPDPIGGTVLDALLHGTSSDGIFKQINELSGHLQRNILRMLTVARKGGTSWWVTQAGGFDRLVCMAAAAAERRLAALSDRSWGALHLTHLQHGLTAALGFPPGSFLDISSMPTGGDTNTLCQTATRSLADLSACSTHVSARIVMDLSDLAHKSLVATPLGTSETAGSPHVGGATCRTWHKGEYTKLRWEMSDIKAAAQYETTFGDGSSGA